MTTTRFAWRRLAPSAAWISLATLLTAAGLALLGRGVAMFPLPAFGGVVGAVVGAVALRGLYLLFAGPYLVAACLGSLFEAVVGSYHWGRFWLNGLRYLGRAYLLAWRLLLVAAIALGCGAGWARLHAVLGGASLLWGDAVIALVAACYLSVIGPCTVVRGGTAPTRASRLILRRSGRVLTGLALWAAAGIWMLGLATVAGHRGPWVEAAAAVAALFVFCLLYGWGLGLLALGPGAPPRDAGRRCAACGATVPAGARFCPACGADLARGRRRRASLAVIVACLVAALPVGAPATAAPASDSSLGSLLNSATPTFTPSQTCAIESSITGGAYTQRACLTSGASPAAFERALFRQECRAWAQQSATFEAQLQADQATATDEFQRVAVDTGRLVATILNLSCPLSGGSTSGTGVLKAVQADVQKLLDGLVVLETTPDAPPGSFGHPIVPPVTLSLGVGSAPRALLYAGSSQRLYVADPGADRVWILPASLGSTDGAVTLPGEPMGMSRDGPDHRLFVTYATASGGDALAGVSTSDPQHPTILWTDPLSPAAGYADLAYDPVNGDVYAAAPCQLEAFAGGTGTALASVSLPAPPGSSACPRDAILYDPALNDLIIVPFGSGGPDTLEQFDPATAQVVRSLCLGTAFQTVQGGQATGSFCAGSGDSAAAVGCDSGPHAVYDAETGDLYVASRGGSRLTVLQAGSLNVLGRWWDGGSVSALAADTSSGEVFAGVNGNSLTGLGNPTQVSGVWWLTPQIPFRDGSAAVVAGVSVFCGIAVNAAADEVYLADTLSGTVSEVPFGDLTALGSTQASAAPAPGGSAYTLAVEATDYCNEAAPWVAGMILPVTGPIDAGAFVAEQLVSDPVASAIDAGSSIVGLYSKTRDSLKAFSGGGGKCGTVVKTG